MTTGDTARFAAQADGETIVIAATPSAALVVPRGTLLLVADFVRQGADLLLEGPDGARVLIKGYFALEEPPALMTEGGAMLSPDLVVRLAGPLAPGQYAQAGPAAEAAPIGRVSTVEGTVTATRADGTQVVLAVDSPLFQGDVLETGSGAAVALVFNDDTTFSLGGDGRMVLDELVYDPDTGEGSSAFSVIQGVFAFVSGQIAKSGPDAMTLRTPVLIVGIRGTTVAGQAEAEGERSLITLIDGEIIVSTPAGSVVMSEANETTLVTSALLPPAPPVVMPQAAVNILYGAVEMMAPQSAVAAPGKSAPAHAAAPTKAEIEAAQSAAANAITDALAAGATADEIMTAAAAAALAELGTPPDELTTDAVAAFIQAWESEAEPDEAMQIAFLDIQNTNGGPEIGADGNLLDVPDSDVGVDIANEYAQFIDVTGAYGEFDGDILVDIIKPGGLANNGFFDAAVLDDALLEDGLLDLAVDEPLPEDQSPPPAGKPPATDFCIPFTSGGANLLASTISALLAGVSFSNATFSGSLNPSASVFNGVDFGTVGDVRFALPPGILLTSGTGVPPTAPADLSVDFGVPDPLNGSSPDGDADLDTLSGQTTFDATTLSFDFTAPPGVNAVVFVFMFGSEEFPEFAAPTTDIAAVFVDGQNALFLPDGGLVRFLQGSNEANFFDNTSNALSIAYDGVSAPGFVVAPLGAGPSHTLKIAIADTADSVIDSALFISGIGVGTPGPTGTGGGDPNGRAQV